MPRGLDLGEDHLAPSAADDLAHALAQTPAVRSEKVALARGLIKDASYPPAVLIHKISTLLAIHVDKARPSS
jgi:hypothetical protein